MTSFNEYADETSKTAIYPDAGEGTLDAISYVVHGLTSEAGEVAGLMKRVYRDDDGRVSDDRLVAFKKELGDVLWYVARACLELDLDLDDVAVLNIERLLDRQKRGTLHGAGSNR